MFDFRRITLFCLAKRLSKHKMTIFSKNLRGGMAPFAPLATPMERTAENTDRYSGPRHVLRHISETRISFLEVVLITSKTCSKCARKNCENARHPPELSENVGSIHLTFLATDSPGVTR